MKTIAIMTPALLLTMCSPAFAQDAPVTGHPLADQVFAWIGTAITVLTILATVLPRAWRLTQILARFAMDLRGILTADPKDDPSWIKPNLLVFVFAGVIATLGGCAGLKQNARTVNDAANVLCELFGVENPEVLQGASVSDYCAVKENLDPFIESILAAKQGLKASLNAEPVSE
jgi:hypothetical protein